MRSQFIIFNLALFISLLSGSGVMAQPVEVTIPLEPVQPSLWWTAIRFEQGLVESWKINSNTRQVAVIIDPGVWSNKDYVRRYAFIQKLGSAVFGPR